MRWHVVIVRLPSSPSRHRVAAWRELRRLGAVPIGQSTWTIPDTTGFVQGIDGIASSADAAGGEVIRVRVDPDDRPSNARLADAFAGARREEWDEFLVECDRFIAEIDKELAKKKLTVAELDEEEQSLDRLRRWYREIHRRDVLASAESKTAAQRLAACETKLEDYAEQVFHVAQGG
jgi:hypothetical protein